MNFVDEVFDYFFGGVEVCDNIVMYWVDCFDVVRCLVKY